MRLNKLKSYIFLIICLSGLFLSSRCFAHFGMIIPSTDIVEEQSQSNLELTLMFAHPFEGNTMEMEKPVECGVYFGDKKQDLTSQLTTYKVKNYNDSEFHKGWRLNYKINKPGDYIFYVRPKPYWEPAEDSYIIHYTKVIVDAFGKEDGWDKEVGLKAEIIALTRPFGIYSGNVFQGIVKFKGKPVPFCRVEVEYFNQDGKYKAPKSALITQVIKCDENGVFSYGLPKEGWWGFAALNEDDKTIKHNGEEKSVEIGAVLWIKAYKMQ